ncbi:hypothetical protein [Dulcicalothrix desertica]|nr:hypothetical protein [Dulcicalothrix desertica]
MASQASANFFNLPSWASSSKISKSSFGGASNSVLDAAINLLD